MSKQRKKRVLGKIRIQELSSVNRPAQEDAKQVLIKRHEEVTEGNFEQIGKDLGLTTPAMLTVTDGHQHLIDLADQSGDTTYDVAEGEEFGHSHPWLKTLEGSVIIGMSGGHTHKLLKTTKNDGSSNVDGSKEPAPSAETVETEETQVTDKIEKTAEETKELDAAKEQIEKQEAQIARLVALTSLDAISKAHFDALDTEGQDAFLKLDANGRKTEMTKDIDPDVVYKSIGGRVFTTNDDAALVELAKRADDMETSLASERASRKREQLEKRAKDFGNLKGSDSAKVELLKAVDSLGDSKDEVLEILKAANEVMAKNMTRAGHAGGPVEVEGSDAEAQLDTLAKDHQTKNVGMSFEKAYTEILSTEKGRELYEQIR